MVVMLVSKPAITSPMTPPRIIAGPNHSEMAFSARRLRVCSSRPARWTREQAVELLANAGQTDDAHGHTLAASKRLGDRNAVPDERGRLKEPFACQTHAGASQREVQRLWRGRSGRHKSAQHAGDAAKDEAPHDPLKRAS